MSRNQKMAAIGTGFVYTCVPVPGLEMGYAILHKSFTVTFARFLLPMYSEGKENGRLQAWHVHNIDIKSRDTYVTFRLTVI